MAKIYLHWTATPYNWVRSGSYHTIVTGDGQIHRMHDYNTDLHAHTWKRNSNSIGIACACMGGENPWSTPPTDTQVEAMCHEVARVATNWGWSEAQIDVRHIMTHAEAASNKDGWNAHENYGPVSWGGTGERWDLMQLSPDDSRNVGDVLREKILGHFRGTTRPTQKLRFVSESTIEANGKMLSTSIDENGLSWAKATDLLSIYSLSYKWDHQRSRIFIDATDITPKYLQDQVQADIGYPLFEMSLNGSDSPIILVGIVQDDTPYCRVLEFAEELAITTSFNPFILRHRLGG